MITPKLPLPKPPMSDSLYQALSPLPDILTQKQRIEQIMEKYGRKPHKEPLSQPRQWIGDDHA